MLTAGKIDVNELVQEEPLFRVHRRIYADPEIFELEMLRIFGRTWVYVAHESEIKNPGDYKATYIGRQPVIVSRFEDGSIHVLYNRCMHRASIVCRDERGNSNRFRCPYHGWTYRNDGTLIGVPYRDTYPPNFDFGQWSLVSVARVASYQGFIFANQSPDGADLEESLGAYKVTFDNLVDRSPTGEIELGPVAHKYDFAGNWKFQMENANDPYHGPFVHESTTQIRQEWRTGMQPKGENSEEQQRRSPMNLDRTTHHSFPYGHQFTLHAGGERRAGSTHDEYVAALEKRWGPSRTEEILDMTYFNKVYYPNLIVQNDVHVRMVRPVSVNHSIVTVQPIFLRGAPAQMRRDTVKFINYIWAAASFQQTDDTEIFARNQEGLQAEAPEWLILAAGQHRETEGPTPGERVGKKNDETVLRGQHRAWKELMARE